MRQSITLPADNRDAAINRLATVLRSLPPGPYRVDIAEHKATRTNQQNALLWALYDDILRKGGESMGGWTKDDLHDFFLIHHFGSETRTLFGRKRLVPLKRSSRLSKLEFAAFVESILQFMAERGVYLNTEAA